MTLGQGSLEIGESGWYRGTDDRWYWYDADVDVWYRFNEETEIFDVLSYVPTIKTTVWSTTVKTPRWVWILVAVTAAQILGRPGARAYRRRRKVAA